MNVLFTGKNGFLGKELVPKIAKLYTVFAPSRNELNYLDQQQVEKYISDNDIKIILHAAIKGGRRKVVDTEAVFYQNLLMFENLIRNWQKLNLFINFDSAASFDRRQNIHEFIEEDVGNSIPIDYYGFSKYVITQRCKQYDNCKNLRIFNCFGTLEESQRMIKSNITRYINNEDIIIHKNKMMDFFFVDDLYEVIKYYLNNKIETLHQIYSSKRTIFL